jgi:hypothetical protein
MIFIALFALTGAGQASVGAKIANVLNEFRAAAHERRRRPTQIRAVEACSSALGVVPEARRRAMFAFLRASGAGVNSRFKFFV